MARKKVDSSRAPGGFVAIPWSVLDCAAYQSLSHPAKSLLLDIARQYVRDNNGRLLVSMNRLRPRGWSSADVLTRAKRELIDAGLLFETVKGQRPNKASWYALTWFSLDQHTGFDAGVSKAFIRGAYLKNAPLIPSRGVAKSVTAPCGGIEGGSPIPPAGAVSIDFSASSIPSPGNHLETPSPIPEKERGSHGGWVAGYPDRLAAAGPQFLAASPVGLPDGTDTPQQIRKSRQRPPLSSPHCIRLAISNDRGALRLAA